MAPLRIRFLFSGLERWQVAFGSEARRRTRAHTGHEVSASAVGAGIVSGRSFDFRGPSSG
jgi:hypothetical protein